MKYLEPLAQGYIDGLIENGLEFFENEEAFKKNECYQLASEYLKGKEYNSVLRPECFLLAKYEVVDLAVSLEIISFHSMDDLIAIGKICALYARNAEGDDDNPYLARLAEYLGYSYDCDLYEAFILLIKRNIDQIKLYSIPDSEGKLLIKRADF